MTPPTGWVGQLAVSWPLRIAITTGGLAGRQESLVVRVPLWLSGLVTLPGLLSMYCKSVRTCSLLDPNLQKGLYIILFMDTSLLLAKKLNIFFGVLTFLCKKCPKPLWIYLICLIICCCRHYCCVALTQLASLLLWSFKSYIKYIEMKLGEVFLPLKMLVEKTNCISVCIQATEYTLC